MILEFPAYFSILGSVASFLRKHIFSGCTFSSTKSCGSDDDSKMMMMIVLTIVGINFDYPCFAIIHLFLVHLEDFSTDKLKKQQNICTNKNIVTYINSSTHNISWSNMSIFTNNTIMFYNRSSINNTM